MRGLLLLAFLNHCSIAYTQTFQKPEISGIFRAGYKNIIAVDSGRNYKQHTAAADKLHFRRIEIDFWYPANESKAELSIPYSYFLDLLEQRSNRFQDDTVYTKMTTELVEYLSANLKISNTAGLTQLPTASYLNASPFRQRFPLIVYLCSYNGMSFENITLFESLAEQGYAVACITSVGRYPGNMTTQLPDLLEQVADADFAIHLLKKQLNVDSAKISATGYSWGGLAAMVLSMNNTEVKSLLSLDGSEMHYYGDSKEEDQDFNQIVNFPEFRKKKLNIPYAYLESGFKQADQDADSIFQISGYVTDRRYYIRFKKATHEDFSLLPSLGTKVYGTNFTGENPSVPYIELALRFFDGTLKGKQNEWVALSDTIFKSGMADSVYPVVRIKKNLILIKGRIVDEKNREPLAFVNVGIQNKNTGTVSAQNGSFLVKIDSVLMNDSLTFSMAGYQTRMIGLAGLLKLPKPVIISLTEKISDLKEVIITSKAFKTKVLGNTTTSNFISVGLPLKFLGSETGIKLHLGKKPVLLKNFSFNISYNRLDTAVFRLNIYSIRNGSPFENIMHRNILVPVGKQTGLYTIDLKDYKLILNGDVLLSLEWIEGSSAGSGNGAIFLSAGFLNSATWHRLTSQAKWKKATGLGVGFNVVIQKFKE